MKGSFVGGLIAQIEGEFLGVDYLAGCEVKAGLLQPEGAMAQPMMLGHGLNKCFFRRSGGLVVVAEGGEESVEFGLTFRREHPEEAGRSEPMAEVIARSGGFAGSRFGTGGVLRIGLIGGVYKRGP